MGATGGRRNRNLRNLHIIRTIFFFKVAVRVWTLADSVARDGELSYFGWQHCDDLRGEDMWAVTLVTALCKTERVRTISRNWLTTLRLRHSVRTKARVYFYLLPIN